MRRTPSFPGIVCWWFPPALHCGWSLPPDCGLMKPPCSNFLILVLSTSWPVQKAAAKLKITIIKSSTTLSLLFLKNAILTHWLLIAFCTTLKERIQTIDTQALSFCLCTFYSNMCLGLLISLFPSIYLYILYSHA